MPRLTLVWPSTLSAMPLQVSAVPTTVQLTPPPLTDCTTMPAGSAPVSLPSVTEPNPRLLKVRRTVVD